LKIRVECHAGYRGEEEPRAFTLGERRFAILEIRSSLGTAISRSGRRRPGASSCGTTPPPANGSSPRWSRRTARLQSAGGAGTPLARRLCMSLREIPTREWPIFLAKLGREHRAWLATVDRGGKVEAREQPLESIAADRGIDIHIGHKAFHVDEPQAVRVQETAGGATQALQIDDASGRRLTLRFRIAAAPGALDGLAPGET
jgi:hypothetical protein